MAMSKALLWTVVILVLLVALQLYLRYRYRLLVRSYLLVDGLTLRPHGRKAVVLVGYNNGVDISCIASAEDLFYRVESHPLKRIFHVYPDFPKTGMADDWNASHFKVQIFLGDKEIWCHEIPHHEALKVREAVDSIRKRARSPGTGDKIFNEADYRWS